MPPSFVTCYICGREFGTRSIGIHVPKCKEKWETQQEKLPKAERRPVPSAPENFDKILSGEIKGKELVKLNQQAFDDYNTSALETCTNCGRTFKPEALERHKKGCKEDKPMLKKKGPGYTSRMKAKVSYPKLKKTESEQKHDEDSCENVQDDSPSPSVLRKETVILSKSGDSHNEMELTSSSVSTAEPVKKSTSLSRKDTIVIQRHHDNSTDELKSPSRNDEVQSSVTSLPPRSPGKTEPKHPPRVGEDQVKSLSKLKPSNKNDESVKATPMPKPQKSTLMSGNETTSLDKAQKAEFSKKSQKNRTTKSSSDSSSSSSVPSKEDVIHLVETEAIFDDKEHRKAILDLVTNYAKNVHKEQILGILDHDIFDDISHLEEVVTILGDFVAAKLNNNC